MKFTSLAVGIAFAALPLIPTSSFGQGESPPPIVDPQVFADSAASSNTFEIQSSKMALDASQNSDVVAFAEQMLADHTDAGEQMLASAQADGITPATEIEELHQAQLDELAALEGEAFDDEYVAAQVAAHRAAVSLFQSFATDGQDSNLKTFAAETLPTLERHLDHIVQIAEQ
ncbi:DUF4142 domain-containing protein [Pelagibacterium luteolum]|uniref:Putative membrane protein n=1 Tax=Pelagibacterium luteolum TaxID=440168 RepID=A0A1G8A9K0_9HYPH|nr:DUF4142 domain-containing protein [Pelagibacterium luteolum]SDH17020.1 putative membrane protein [Pelagibacterium luteolum]